MGVQFVPPETVAPLYARTAAVLDACLQAPSVEAAAQYRAEQLTDVLGEVQCHARPRVQTPIVALDTATAPLAPLRIAVTQVTYAPGLFSTGLRWGAVYHPDVLRVLDAVLPSDDTCAVSASVPSSSTSSTAATGDTSATLLVVGNDFLLRLVAGACLHLCAARGDSAAPLRDARFCLVPAGTCRFAELLAARDPAYRAHVVDPLRYLSSVCPRPAPVQQQQQQQRRRAPAGDMDGRALPSPASCACALVESFCTDAQCTLAVPVTVCQCDDLQRRTCHAHVFFAQCAVSSQMEKQQPATAKPSFNVALAFDVVAPDGSTQHVTETRKIAAAILSRPVSKLFRMDLVLSTEDDVVCVFLSFPLLSPSFLVFHWLFMLFVFVLSTAQGKNTVGNPRDQPGHEHQRRQQGPLCHCGRPAVRSIHAPPLCPHPSHHALCTLSSHFIKHCHHNQKQHHVFLCSVFFFLSE